MVDESKIDMFEKFIDGRRPAMDSNLEIATILLLQGITLQIVYNKESRDIVQGYFNGIETDLFERYEGDFKTGHNEYPRLVEMLESGELVRHIKNRPTIFFIEHAGRKTQIRIDNEKA